MMKRGKMLKSESAFSPAVSDPAAASLPSSGHVPVSKGKVRRSLGGLPAGARDSGLEASSEARDETGAHSLVTQGLEGILKKC